MRVLPVLDLRDGHIVRAIAGRRAEYRPVVSKIATSSLPLNVADGFRSQLGLSEMYVADLDAISVGSPNFKSFKELHANGFRTWVDAGIRCAEDAGPLFDTGVERVIAGWETMNSCSVLRHVSRRWGAERIVFSLDLLPGRPADSEQCLAVVREAVAAGITSIIVLDIARVGTGQGTGTEQLCQQLLSAFPGVELLAGGGIRSREDLLKLRREGVRGALIASAFHDGRICREDLVGLQV
jgi:phosphoribosylformimino-5-aminoimidazole carboxamide ribotide isomerase